MKKWNFTEFKSNELYFVLAIGMVSWKEIKTSRVERILYFRIRFLNLDSHLLIMYDVLFNNIDLRYVMKDIKAKKENVLICFFTFLFAF